MTMHINLSPEMESFIKGKVASGFYGNATEVIRDAIRRMQTEDAQASVTATKSSDALDRDRGVARSTTDAKSQRRSAGRVRAARRTDGG